MAAAACADGWRLCWGAGRPELPEGCVWGWPATAARVSSTGEELAVREVAAGMQAVSGSGGDGMRQVSVACMCEC
jgi:hypothetical protein